MCPPTKKQLHYSLSRQDELERMKQAMADFFAAASQVGYVSRVSVSVVGA